MPDAIVLPLPRARRRRRAALLGGAISTPLLVASALLFVAAITSTSLCTGVGSLLGAIGDTRGKLTPSLTRAINQESARFDVDPYVIGALAMRESAGGADPSCSASGACGAMQLMPSYWQANRCDGDLDGRAVITDVDDNVCAAINGLLHDKRTLIAGRRMSRAEIEAMARSYCGSCTDEACGGSVDGGYCEGVVRDFERLGGKFGDGRSGSALAPIATGEQASAGCAAEAATVPVLGPVGWTIASGANLPGRPLSPLFVAFMDTVARFTSYRPVLTTGTNHSEYTVDGNVSDHYTGHAGDFGASANGFGTDNAQSGQPVPRGDELATAAFIAAGIDPPRAHASAIAGGLRNVDFSFQGQSVRLQVIWKTDEGGNHHNHVHIGIRPA